VVLRGETIAVDWIRTEPHRRDEPIRRKEARAFLIGYGHDRYLHHCGRMEDEDEDGGLAWDVAWLSKDGAIAEMGVLKEKSAEGVTSSVEARYALFLPPGRLAALGAKVGDPVTLPRDVSVNPPDDLPEIRVGGVAVRVEVSEKYAERTRGLMYRRRISDANGMLFVYGSPRGLHFWMKNCHFPLDIAFFDADGQLLNVVPTPVYPDPKDPPSDRSSSEGDAKYVLEVNLGWFQKKGLPIDDQGRPTKPVRLELPEPVQSLARDADP
jgi:uncharacterized membrane protein (UPF0127 family)